MPSIEINPIKPRATRFPELFYAPICPNLWRILDVDGAAIGPQYRSKAELLADLNRYAADYGCGQ
jgi:hypothetical protein